MIGLRVLGKVKWSLKDCCQQITNVRKSKMVFERLLSTDYKCQEKLSGL